MAIDERSRHSMYSRLKELMGEEDATVLMEHLPPVGWADVATKRDLDALRTEMKAEFNGLRVDLFKALTQQTNKMVGWVLGAVSTLTAAFTAVSLTVD